MIAEKATIHYKDGTSQVLARLKGSQRFYILDGEGKPGVLYRTRRTLEEWPQRDRRCDRVEYESEGKS